MQEGIRSIRKPARMGVIRRERGGGSLENSTYQCNYDCWDGSNLIFLSYFRWNSGISDLVTSFGAMRYFFKKQALPPALLHISHRYLNI